MYAQIIQTLNPVIVDYDRRIEKVSMNIPRPICSTNSRCWTRAGPAAVELLCTDRSRYEAAGNVQSFSGIAPVTKAAAKAEWFIFGTPAPNLTGRPSTNLLASRSPSANGLATMSIITRPKVKISRDHSCVGLQMDSDPFPCWKIGRRTTRPNYMDNLKKRGSIFATLHLEQKS